LQAVVTLYRVSDASGEIIMDKVGEKPLHQDMLNSTVSKHNRIICALVLCSWTFFVCYHFKCVL